MFADLICTIICPLWTFLLHPPNLHPMPQLMPLCLLLLLQKGFSTACWAAVQQRFREMDMNRAKGRQRGVEGPGCGRAQRVAPAKAAQRNVCVCVCAPMCLSRRGTTSLPHQRSTVDDLLPRLTTVGPHSHLSPYTDRSVSS